MRINSLATALILALFCGNLSAQNNHDLQNISKQKLESLLKEHKQLHFVTTQGSNGTEVKFHIDNSKPEKQATVQSAANSNTAINFHLVKDINIQTDANPVNKSGDINDDRPYAILNDVMYFSANNGVNGTELWRSDGTPSGTYMVKDIEPGIAGSNPSEIIAAGNKIIFTTLNQNTYDYGLWASDGTASGTTVLKDHIGHGQGVNSTYGLTNVSGTVYFFLNYAQLWKTSGTVSGTTLVKDFGADGIAPFLPIAFNGLFYFTIYTNANGRELWRSDGSDSGTFMLKDISPGTDFFAGPEQLTVFNNKLYFTANDGSGRKLWLTNGTTAGTVPGSGENSVLFADDDIIMDLYNRPFVVIGNSFYTGASKGTTGTELYKYNIANGFKLVKDITPGMAGGGFLFFENFENTVVFTYYDSVNKKNQLWRSGGSATNTVLLKSYPDSVYLSNLHTGGTFLYFESNASNGYELSKTNGTPAGTAIIKDIYAGKTSSDPSNLTYYNGLMYFKAASKNAGTEIWHTNGSSSGTAMMPEINTTSTNYSAPGYTSFSTPYYNNLPGAVINNTLYFSATRPETGYELYKSNGTLAGTALVSDAIAGEEGSSPEYFVNKNDAIYFINYGSYSFNSNPIINKIDSSGTVRKIVSAASDILSMDVADNGLVFYVIDNYSTGKYELWRVADNGSDNILLTDKLTGDYYYTSSSVKAIKNKAYFTAVDENGTELWVSDGSIAGTHMVKDILAGSRSSKPYSLVAYNNNIYFGANDGSGFALWRSNGTKAGTIKIKNIAPHARNSYSDNYENSFCVANNILYLVASSVDKGEELWKTDGTPAGTVLVKDITTGTESTKLGFLTNVNGTLFFSFYNYQLWKSDGTANGTVIVKDNIYSPDYYLFTERCVADDKLFFNTGHLLWVSDGTDAGTHAIEDNGLNGVSNVKNLVAGGNTVFFNGTTDKYNAELYAGDATKVINSNISVMKQVQQPSFSAAVLQNPLLSQLRLQVQSSVAQSMVVIISNENGNIIAQKTVNAVNGANQFAFDASAWQTGLYAIKISNTKGEAISLKVLK